MVGGARTDPVLITGCSSGIGRARRSACTMPGCTVYATARRLGHALRPGRAGASRTLALDVTDEASMTAAVDGRRGDAGAVGVLINNAGYGLYGPVEQVPMDEVRRQFETNFFGLVRLTQLVLPGMRRRRRRPDPQRLLDGRPGHPARRRLLPRLKYAVEAFSDALRMEVAQFGIDVVLIEPGPVKTPWNDVAAGSARRRPASGRRSRSLRGVQGRGRRLVRTDATARWPGSPRPPRTSPRSSPGPSPPTAANALPDQPGRQEHGRR